MADIRNCPKCGCPLTESLIRCKCGWEYDVHIRFKDTGEITSLRTELDSATKAMFPET